ncbi:ABC transporter permease [Tardiphaga sp. 619_E2_N8_5]|uniref:ABC transporter permease n=1 Tax=unclassified Tardiphaga TaxID=2631404 RepID=UPI003F2965A6
MSSSTDWEVVSSNQRMGRFSWAKAWGDINPIFSRSVTWRELAYGDIRSKYRRTFLGPWWITATNGITALIMGLVSGNFLGANMHDYLPHFVISMTVWNFISSSVGESCQTMINAGGMIKAVNMPIVIHVMRMVQRNFIIFLHNIAIVPLVWLVFPWKISFAFVFAIVGFAIIYVFTACASLLVSMVCVRFRDVPPIIASILQLLFFISPIIWMPSQLKGGELVVALNPIGYLLAVTRNPIMSQPVPPIDWLIALAFVVICSLLATFVYSRYRTRVVFWT